MKVQTHTFPNGFRLIYQPSTKRYISSIYAYCNVGSAVETDLVRGASHMIEHMCFQGTFQKLGSKDIFREYDKIGAYLNAYTEKDYTVFKINCDILYLEKCIQVLSDIMIHSQFNETKFYKEQKVVVEENIVRENNSENVVMTKIEELLYQGNSYSFPVDTKRYHPKPDSLKYELLKEWYECYYVPSNMVFSIVSTNSLSKIISMLKKTDFMKECKPKSIPNTAIPSPILSNTFLPQPTYFVFSKKGVDINYVTVGFRTCSYTSNDKYVFMMIDHLLSGPISRLFTLLREKHNLTYGVSCHVDYIKHMGYFVIKVKTDHTHVITNGHFPLEKRPGILSLIIHTIQSIVKKGFEQHEIDHTKGYLYGKMRMNEENIDILADYNGKEWILATEFFCDRFTPYSQIFDTFIKPVTKKRLNDVVKQYFRLNNMVVCILGEKVPSLNSVKSVCEKGW
jgi:predicted Zn-dependent peptidase